MQNLEAGYVTVWIKTFLFKENVANSDFRLRWLSNCQCNSSKINVGISLINRRTMTVTGVVVVLDETCDNISNVTLWNSTKGIWKNDD